MEYIFNVTFQKRHMKSNNKIFWLSILDKKNVNIKKYLCKQESFNNNRVLNKWAKKLNYLYLYRYI